MFHFSLKTYAITVLWGLISFTLKSQVDFKNSYLFSGLSCQRELSNSDYFLLASNMFSNNKYSRTNSLGIPVWSKFLAESATPNTEALVYLKCVQQTTDGGFIITGSYRTSPFFGTDEHVLLVKTDGLGVVQWSKSYGGNTNDIGLWVEQTGDGGYIICGSKNFSALGPLYGDIYIIKTDNSGNQQWDKVLTLSGGMASAQNIKQTLDGGYILTGNTGDEQGSSNVHLIKLTSLGAITWQQEYHVNCPAGFVSSGREVWEIPTGYIIGGFAGGDVLPSESLFLKINANGDMGKVNTYKAANAWEQLGFSSIDVTGNGEFVGTGGGYQTGFKLYLIKADANLNLLWSRTYSSFSIQPATGIRQTADLGYALVDGSNLFLKTDPQGLIHCETPNFVLPSSAIATKAVLSTTPKSSGVQNTLSLVSTSVIISSNVLCTPLEFQIVGIDVKCKGKNTGAATATVVFGTAPFSYTWSPIGGNTQTISNLTAGVYTVTISDNTGALSSKTITITEPPLLSITLTPTDLACYNNSNGQVISSVQGGTPAYTYSWNNGSTTGSITGLSEGNYELTVTDANGCSAITTTVIAAPPPLSGQFTKGTANCTGCGCKEWIILNATGGLSPYSYTWPDGYDKRYKNQLCPGNYTIKIKDKNGCSANVEINTP
ncbi:MAG: SprB repeat-containing protein [Bacteroidetes bacterium]|nr:SprB repeat-containing protein [Bacteroidota bacterium]